MLGSLRAPEVALREAAESALQLIVGHSNLNNVLTGAGRDSLAHGAVALTQAALDAAGGGVRSLAVNITDMQLPDTVLPDQREVSKAIEDQARMAPTGRPMPMMSCRGRVPMRQRMLQDARQRSRARPLRLPRPISRASSSCRPRMRRRLK